MVPSLAKKAGSALIASSNRTSSNRGSGENKCSDDMPSTESRVCATKPIYHGDRQEQ